MRITGINLPNNYNKTLTKKNSTTPTFKSAGSAEHYAMELMQIDNSEIAKSIIANNKTLLPVKAIREFIADFLNGVKFTKGINQYTKNSILRSLQYNFKDFIYKDGWYYRTSEEELNANKPKCSYADIADNNGNISEAAMETAVRLARMNGSDHNLPDFLKASKDADGSIDYYVGYMIKDLLERVGDWDFTSIMQYQIYRDEKGNVNRQLLDKIHNSPKNKTWDIINHWGLKSEDDIFNEYAKKNLYLAENYYKFLVDLGKNRLIYSNEASIMYKEIGDYGKILFILPDIPRTEENKETYDKIMKYLSSNNTFVYNLNQKDKSGISFIEKVINSENIQLLDMIKRLKKKDLVYYPELDWAVNGVQNQEFKEKLKELDFKFEVLEKTAELRSIKAMQKFDKLLELPLCDKNKMIEKIWKIASSQKQGVDTLHDFGKYISERFWGDDVSDDLIFSILEKIKQ